MMSVKTIDNETAVLILQHPQEKKRAHGTVNLLAQCLDNVLLKSGLSWKSLSSITGQEVNPKHWGVLYLGTKKQLPEFEKDQMMMVLDAKGAPKKNQSEILDGIQGIITLDGSWSEAKTLWWRNAWLLKTHRLVLNPKKISQYKKLRRSPRKENLSTFEAVTLCLEALQTPKEQIEVLKKEFDSFLSSSSED